MPAAALAVVRAAVESAHGDGVQDARAVARLVADDLLAAGWTLAPAVEEPAQQPAA